MTDINSITEPTWIRIFTRPSKDVKWFWEHTQFHHPYIAEHYRDTGKFRSELELSDDGLTLAVSFFFDSDESAEEWQNDDYMVNTVFPAFIEYNLENGIERIL